MPTLTTRGAMTALSFGYGYKAPVSAVYWMALYNNAGVGNLGGAYAPALIDSSNNKYFWGTDGYGYGAVMVKYDDTGTIQFQEQYGTYPAQIGYGGGAIDSSNNLFFSGVTSSATPFVSGINTTGGIVWQRKIDKGTGLYNNLSLLAADSSNVYVIQNTAVSVGCCTLPVPLYAVFSTSGTFSLARTFVESGYHNSAFGISTLSGNVFCFFKSENYSVGASVGVIKFDSSGSVVDKKYVSFGSGVFGNMGYVDSSGNIYIGSANLYFFKMDSSYTQTFSSNMTASGFGNDFINAVAVDGSGNSYWVGSFGTSNGGKYQGFIIKFNSSGTVQWQRSLSYTSNHLQLNSVAIDNNGGLVVSGGTNNGSNYGSFAAKLPADGSKTGTYTVGGLTIVYAASSYTISGGNTQTIGDLGTLTVASVTPTTTTTSFGISSLSKTGSTTTI
jgi:hypothetical protein